MNTIEDKINYCISQGWKINFNQTIEGLFYVRLLAEGMVTEAYSHDHDLNTAISSAMDELENFFRKAGTTIEIDVINLLNIKPEEFKRRKLSSGE